ncbi:MAG TPA: hypothetical protein VMI54_26985 [Polyangiaceae bacterium]|nr:hypothetical protein [Polyangiaceae bacterium]
MRGREFVVRAAACLALLGAVAIPSVSAADVTAAHELPELPRAPDELKQASLADLNELDELLARISGDDEAARDDGVRSILELSPRMVPAIRKRLDDLGGSTDKNALKQLLFDTRRAAKDEPHDDVPGAPEEKASMGPDYLTLLLARPRPNLPAWRDLVKVLALSRMLEHVGSTPAVRGLVDVYVRFGDFLRIDTQKALARLGDRAVPALIEARRHPAEKIAHWASRQLDMLGRAAPSQAVQIADPEILADVLRAYGRTHDLDAARIVVSFAGSERGQLRTAARQAIAMFGEAGHWQLRDAYEDVMGKRAARDWTWERTARELFGELDRLRRAEVYDRFEAGQKAEAAGDFETMRREYDAVLERAPFFERGDEMVGGYWEYAKRNAAKRPEDAVLALRHAERLGRNSPAHDRIASLLLTLEAERLAREHIVDRSLYRHALELDSSNARARDALDALSRPVPTGERKLRYYAAAGVFLAGLLGAAFVLFRPRPRDDTKAPAES